MNGNAVELSTIFETPVPDRVISDPTRLRQILLNVVGNSVKFTTKGFVRIRVRCDERDAAARLIIRIEDSGPGMTTEQAAQIFQPFAQADSSITRRHGGTGLGLAISRRLAESMNGSLYLESSAPGHGCTFAIDLPLNPVSGASLVQELPASQYEPTHRPVVINGVLKGRILLAEDGPDNQRLISLQLRRAGAEVEVAENGVVAMSMIERAEKEGTPYDLLVSDMQMPEMDGYTLARELRARGSRIPIIALTAHAMSDDRERCMAAGCDEYDTKPINRDRLVSMCATWIERGRTAASPPNPGRR